MASPKVKVGGVYEYHPKKHGSDMGVVFVVVSEKFDGFVIMPLVMEEKATRVLAFFRFVVGMPRYVARTSSWVRHPERLA